MDKGLRLALAIFEPSGVSGYQKSVISQHTVI